MPTVRSSQSLSGVLCSLIAELARKVVHLGTPGQSSISISIFFRGESYSLVASYSWTSSVDQATRFIFKHLLPPALVPWLPGSSGPEAWLLAVALAQAEAGWGWGWSRADSTPKPGLSTCFAELCPCPAPFWPLG